MNGTTPWLKSGMVLLTMSHLNNLIDPMTKESSKIVRYLPTKEMIIIKIVSFKAWRIVKDYDKKYDVDCHETFAPVTNLTTVRVLAAITISESQHLRHWSDPSKHLSKGTTDEDVYIKHPECFVQMNSRSKVYKLEKSLYGLKQAVRG
jgi:hypothetical protein